MWHLKLRMFIKFIFLLYIVLKEYCDSVRHLSSVTLFQPLWRSFQMNNNQDQEFFSVPAARRHRNYSSVPQH